MLRERILATLPADTLVVVAGKLPPSTAWLTDPGWSALIQTLPLANLSPAESDDDYLHRRSVPPEQRDAAVAFTRGHPLALALVSEVVLTRGSFAPQRAPDVVTALVDQLMQAVPTAEHRLALEATSQVRVLTQPLLAALLEGADASGLFEWLRRLPIVELGPAGLPMHDLAVDVLDAELRWRDPLRYRVLHDWARGFFLDRLSVADPAEQSAAMMDLIFLHQELRPYLSPGQSPRTRCAWTPPSLACCARWRSRTAPRWPTCPTRPWTRHTPNWPATLRCVRASAARSSGIG